MSRQTMLGLVRRQLTVGQLRHPTQARRGPAQSQGTEPLQILQWLERRLRGGLPEGRGAQAMDRPSPPGGAQPTGRRLRRTMPRGRGSLARSQRDPEGQARRGALK